MVAPGCFFIPISSVRFFSASGSGVSVVFTSLIPITEPPDCRRHPYVVRRRLMQPHRRTPSFPQPVRRASIVDRPARRLRQPTGPFPEFCARFGSPGQVAAWIHKSWQSPRAGRCCSVRCPMLPQNERGRLWYRRGRVILCLLATTDQQATEKDLGGPPPAKSRAVPQPVQLLARPSVRASRSRRLTVRRLEQPECGRPNRRLRRKSRLWPESQSG